MSRWVCEPIEPDFIWRLKDRYSNPCGRLRVVHSASPPRSEHWSAFYNKASRDLITSSNVRSTICTGMQQKDLRSRDSPRWSVCRLRASDTHSKISPAFHYDAIESG